jgi:hypothetical protein
LILKIKKVLLILVVTCLMLTTAFVSIAAAASVTVVPVPNVVLVPRTSTSIPFNAADRQFMPLNLAAFGYQEDEYFQSGTANIYTWTNKDSGPASKTGISGPYTTRFIVRKPSDPAKFSGTVIVELLNPSNMWDTYPQWSDIWNKILRDGDVYVGITQKPSSSDALKTYDPVRYAPLNWANPNPATVAQQPQEEGLFWDMLNQLGALLKSGSASNPLKGYKVEKVYATGESQSSMYLNTYINAIRPFSFVAPGKPVFDGYMCNRGGSVRSVRQGESAFTKADANYTVHGSDVPVFAIFSQSEPFLNFAGTGRPDSDVRGDLYRQWDMPGTTHSFFANKMSRTGPVELAAIGKTVALPPENHDKLPDQYIVSAAMVALDKWARKGIPPAKNARFQMTADGKVALDQYDNALGGVRTPYLDVPIATYYAASNKADGSFNWEGGMMVPFTNEALTALYPTKKDYVDPFCAKVDQLVKDGFILAVDGEQMKYDAVATVLPTGDFVAPPTRKN